MAVTEPPRGGARFEPEITKAELALKLVRVTDENIKLRADLDHAERTIATLTVELADMKSRYQFMLQSRRNRF